MLVILDAYRAFFTKPKPPACTATEITILVSDSTIIGRLLLPVAAYPSTKSK